MDVQLQELIDKIKKDGVASAESSAQEIISKAENKAAAIISEAENKADGIIKTAKTETQRMEKASEDAIRQAARNLIISFRDSVTKELSALIKKECDTVYKPELLVKLIPETIKAWTAKTDAEDLSILLNKKDLKDLEDGFQSALKAEISKGLELKSDNSISSGFKIGVNKGEAYYDYTDEAIAELFSSYLNPRTAAIMKSAADEGNKA
ncbi:MAG: V-type ATP synthase subunit E [Treponema sp.]|jgi:V/A-type H+-transporting ATPase subunit E|nr:V-type ATP synthase subunit E [Treponema sp.]